MGMIAVSNVDEWYSSLPKTYRIYRIIETTMDDRNPKERIWALMALGNSRDPRAVRSLIDCCKDQDPEIRLRAIEGLQNLRSGLAVDVLIDRLRDKEELPEIRQRAASALAAIRSYSAMKELRIRNADTDIDGALRSFIGGELDRVQIW